MALPFIAGLALGGLAVAAFNNKDKIKASLEGKLESGFKKGKTLAKDARDYAEKKFEELKGETKKRKRRGSEELAEEKVAKEAAKAKNRGKSVKKRSTTKKPAAPKTQAQPQTQEAQG